MSRQSGIEQKTDRQDMDDAKIDRFVACHGQVRSFVVSLDRICLPQWLYGVVESADGADLLDCQYLQAEPHKDDHDDEGMYVIRQKRCTNA